MKGNRKMQDVFDVPRLPSGDHISLLIAYCIFFLSKSAPEKYSPSAEISEQLRRIFPLRFLAEQKSRLSLRKDSWCLWRREKVLFDVSIGAVRSPATAVVPDVGCLLESSGGIAATEARFFRISEGRS